MLFLLLLLLPLVRVATGEDPVSKVTASGGGIVKPGSDLVLTYQVGQVWDRCTWFWYDDDPENSPFCNFDLDPEQQMATKHVCKPNDRNNIEYTGTSNLVCQITVKNVTVEDNCTWASRVDNNFNNKEISVIVAEQVKSGEIQVTSGRGTVDLRVGERANITCIMHGGRPPPAIQLEVEAKSKAEIMDDMQTQFSDADGLYETTQILTIEPNMEDHARNVLCQALQFDRDGVALFDNVKAESLVLNVTYPPQEMADQEVIATLDEDATVSFEFESNPIPNRIKWLVGSVNIDQDGNAGQEEFSSEHDDDKYRVSTLTQMDELKFKTEFTIKSVSKEDVNKTYRLEASNSVGSMTYEFTLKLGETTTDDSSTEEEIEEGHENESDNEDSSSPVGAVFGILLFVCVVAIVLGAIFVYKKKKANMVTSPLSAMETRN